MTDGDLHPALCGTVPERRIDDGLEAADDGPPLAPDCKAADGPPPGEALADMLNGMTRELREQMQMFRMLRRQTDLRLAEMKPDEGEEIDRKAVQADAKAAIEAMSLVVRTLEKIDSLQRTLAQDRDRRDEEMLDDAGYQALVGRIEALVEQRAAERARETAGTVEATPVVPAGADGAGPDPGG